MVRWLGSLRRRGVAGRVSALGIVVFVALMVTGPVAIRLGGYMALKAAVLAAGLCLAGAIAALVIAN